MDEQPSSTLPYRADADDLRRYVQALAHGGGPDRIRALGFSTKTHEGVIASAHALGLTRGREGPLTEKGRRIAVGDDVRSGEQWTALLAEFEPYRRIVDAIQEGEAPRPVPIEWVETYWAAHGFGSSASNRSEAASAFARMVEAAGMGRFVQGRRGHVSRIEWGDAVEDSAGAPEPARSNRRGLGAMQSAGPSSRRGTASDGPEPGQRGGGVPTPPAPTARPGPSSGEGTPASQDSESGEQVLVWHLGPGRAVRLRMPADLNREEGERVRRMVDLLIGP
jgi:hypothetical protein